MNILKKMLMKDTSEEVKASVAYTICGILTKCLSLITLPIFTRILSTDEYGLSTIYSSTAAILIIFTSLQLPYGTLSTAMIKYKEDRNGYLSSICAITTVLTAIYIVICVIFRNHFEKWLDLPLLLLVVMGIETLFSTANAAWMGQQRFEYQYKRVVAVTLGTSVAAVAFSLLVVYFSTEKGIARVISNAIVVSVVGFVIYVMIMVKGKKPFNKEYWRFALSFNIPLVPYYLSQVIFNQSDRLMINSYCGRGDAAIYGVAYSLATILTFVVTAIHSSYTPWIFERIDKNELTDNRRVSLILSAGRAFMLLGVIALAPEIIHIMAGEKYMDAVWVVPPVAMSILLLYYADLFDCLLFFYEAKSFLTLAAIFSAIINVILNAIFIPKFGFVAAAYTTLASYLILAILDYVYMRVICKKKNIDPDLYNIKGLALLVVILGFIGFLAMSLYNYPIIRYSIITVVFIIMFIFREKLMKLFKSVQK